MSEVSVPDFGLPREWPKPLAWLEVFDWQDRPRYEWVQGFAQGVHRFDERIHCWWKDCDLDQCRSAGSLHELVRLIGGSQVERRLGIPHDRDGAGRFKFGLGPHKWIVMGGGRPILVARWPASIDAYIARVLATKQRVIDTLYGRGVSEVLGAITEGVKV